MDQATTTQVAKADKKMAQRNAKFEKLSRAKKRVTIAKDVLKLLAARRIQAMTTYIQKLPTDPLGGYMDLKPEVKQAQLCSLLPTVKCNVCALGALFVAGVERKDNLTYEEFHNQRAHGTQEAMHAYLEGVFTPAELFKIEDAFENRYGWFDYQKGQPQKGTEEEKASAWAQERNKSLARIMRNIVKNNGTFKVSQAPIGKSSRRARA